MTKAKKTAEPYCFEKLGLPEVLRSGTSAQGAIVWNLEFELLGFVCNLVLEIWNL